MNTDLNRGLKLNVQVFAVRIKRVPAPSEQKPGVPICFETLKQFGSCRGCKRAWRQQVLFFPVLHRQAISLFSVDDEHDHIGRICPTMRERAEIIAAIKQERAGSRNRVGRV